MLRVNAKPLPPHKRGFVQNGSKEWIGPPVWMAANEVSSNRPDQARRVSREGEGGRYVDECSVCECKRGGASLRPVPRGGQPGQRDVCGVEELPHLAVQYQGSRGGRLAARWVCIGVASLRKGHPTDLRDCIQWLQSPGRLPQARPRPRRRGRGGRGKACVWSAKDDAKHLVAKTSPGSQRCCSKPKRQGGTYIAVRRSDFISIPDRKG